MKVEKVTYLQNENRSLKNEISDLKQTILINKTQIDILSRQLQTNPQNKKLIDVIYGYRSRQEQLQSTLAKYKQEIDKLNSDNLVVKQLNEEQCSEIKSLECMNVEVVKELQKKVRELEEKIIFYERNHKEYDKVAGFVLKNREIFSPQEMVIQLRNKQEQLNNEIKMMKASVEDSRKRQENLMYVNTLLRQKIVTLQAKLAVPDRQLREVLDKSLKKLMLYFLQVQKKIVDGNEDSESEEENDIDLIAPELNDIFPQKKLRIQKDYGVPHLDLLKVRDQMQQNNTKIKQALLARNHLSDKEKIERLQIQLEYTRRELTRKIIDIKEEKEKRKKAQIILSECQNRNMLLIKSNQKLQQKVKNYWKVIQQKMNSSIQLDELVAEESTERENKQKKQTRKQQIPMIQSQIDFKIHLELMAKDLQKNQKLKNLKKLKQIGKEEEEQPKMKRSNSNPFLYFNERRNKILEVKDIEKQNDISNLRLEQTYYAPGKKIGFEEVLDQLDI